MKRLLGLVVLFVPLAFLTSEAYAEQQFIVNGELRPDGIVIQNGTGGNATILPKGLNFASASVVVAHDIVNSTGETDTVELASGQFQDGFVTLRGKIDEPINAKIVVDTEEGERLTSNTVISPGITISFVLVESLAQLELLGTSRKVRDPTKKFTISGDLSSLDGDLNGSIVQVKSYEYSSTGDYNMLNYGRVMLDRGKFIIEAEVAEPRVVNIVIIGRLGHTQVPAVVEPGVEISLSSQNSWIKGVFATSSEASRHFRLVDSWQQREAYLTIRKEYLEAYQEF